MKKIMILLCNLMLAACEKDNKDVESYENRINDVESQEVQRSDEEVYDGDKLEIYVNEDNDVCINVLSNNTVNTSMYLFDLDEKVWEKKITTDSKRIEDKLEDKVEFILNDPVYDGNIYMRNNSDGDYVFEDDYYVKAKEAGYEFKWVYDQEAVLNDEETPIVYGVFYKDSENEEVFDESLYHDPSSINFPIVAYVAQVEGPVY